MSRVSGRTCARLTNCAVAVVAALVLSACGAATLVSPRVVGVPSINISVPLQTVACTQENSCVAVGTTSASVGPTSAGELRERSGRWVPVAVPDATSSFVTSASCWSTECLFAGSQPSGDLLWRYDATNRTVVVAPAPTGALGVNAVACYAEAGCALVDAGANGTPRFSITANGGASWTAPSPVPWATGLTVTGLACSAEFNCLVSATSNAGILTVEVTHDGGATWVARSVPSNWTSLRSLSCQSLRCVALAATATGTELVRTTTFGRVWTDASLAHDATALSCASIDHCVLVGEKDASTPWLATATRLEVTALRLRYVPSSILDVSCGSKVCGAIAITTVMALRP